MVTVDLGTGEQPGGIAPVRLSSTERRLVEALRDARGSPVGRDALAIAVWGEAGDLRRVDFAVRRLRRKIEPNPSAPSVVLTVHGRGYQWGEPRPEIAAPVPSVVIRLGDRSVDLGSGAIDDGERLTSQELAVFRVLLEARGVPVSRDRLLAEVWGWRSSRRSRRPDGVIHQLRRKLEPVPERPRFLTGERGTGWRLAVDPVRTNAVPPLGSFVGRSTLLGEVGELLATERWLVLTGPPGVGKTRLALELCGSWADRFTGGAWFVDLASALTVGDVVQRLVATFGLVPGADPWPSVAAFLATGPARLVVLDNVEQIEGLAGLVRTALGVPPIRWLATSRRPVGVPGERIVPVPVLAPDDARTLFLERVARAGHRVEPGPWVDELIEGLDRLPLALELAAAWGAGVPGAPSKHQLQVTIARSWALLDPDLRRALRLLCAFPDGLPVATMDQLHDGRADSLQALALASLIRVDAAGWFAPYAVVRSFVLDAHPPTVTDLDARDGWLLGLAERLETWLEDGREAEAREVSTRWVSALAAAGDRVDPDPTRAARIVHRLASCPWLGREVWTARALTLADCDRVPNELRASLWMDLADDRLRFQSGSAREALDRAAALDPSRPWPWPDLAARLAFMDFAEARRVLGPLPDGPPSARFMWLHRSAYLRLLEGDAVGADPLARRAEALAVAFGWTHRLGRVAEVRHGIALDLLDLPGALAAAERSVAIHEAFGDMGGLVCGLMWQSTLLPLVGRSGEAAIGLDRAEQLCRHLGLRRYLHDVAMIRARNALLDGRWDEALAHATAGEELCRVHGAPIEVAISCVWVGLAHLAVAAPDRAIEAFDRSLSLNVPEVEEPILALRFYAGGPGPLPPRPEPRGTPEREFVSVVHDLLEGVPPSERTALATRDHPTVRTVAQVLRRFQR